MSLIMPRRAEEFRGVFEFLDKNGDGALTKDEIRYIMNGMGHDLTDDEIRDLIADIGGPGASMVDEAHFLNFVAVQLQGDPAEELRECWKITSNQTDTKFRKCASSTILAPGHRSPLAPFAPLPVIATRRVSVSLPWPPRALLRRPALPGGGGVQKKGAGESSPRTLR